MSPLSMMTVLNPFQGWANRNENDVGLLSALADTLGGFGIRQVWARPSGWEWGFSLVNHGLEIQHTLDEFGSEPRG